MNIMNSSAYICGIVIAFVYSWALTLVTFALSPFIFLGGYLYSQYVTQNGEKNDAAYINSSNLIMEAVTNIKTL
jgi:ATP-binding cassette subfamily B (MDR/TAP) protein 1